MCVFGLKILHEMDSSIKIGSFVLLKIILCERECERVGEVQSACMCVYVCVRSALSNKLSNTENIISPG